MDSCEAFINFLLFLIWSWVLVGWFLFGAFQLSFITINFSRFLVNVFEENPDSYSG